MVCEDKGISFLIGSNVDYYEGYKVDGFQIDLIQHKNGHSLVVDPIYLD